MIRPNSGCMSQDFRKSGPGPVAQEVRERGIIGESKLIREKISWVLSRRAIARLLVIVDVLLLFWLMVV